MQSAQWCRLTWSTFTMLLVWFRIAYCTDPVPLSLPAISTYEMVAVPPSATRSAHMSTEVSTILTLRTVTFGA